jgi:hypothetical protein
MKLHARLYKHLQDNQRVFAGGRIDTIGSSEIFACLRKAWYARNNPEAVDQSTRNLGILERGNVIENAFFVPAMRGIFGAYNCHYMGDTQRTFRLGRLSATPDGLITGQPDDLFADDGLPSLGYANSALKHASFVIENKSFDMRSVISEEREYHRCQAIVQMGMIRRQTVHHPEYAVITYINASDYLDVRPFFVKYDDDVFVAAQERAETAYRAKEAYDLPAEGVAQGDCEYCDFVRLCRGTDADHFPTSKTRPDDNVLGALRSLASEYLEHRGVEQAAEKRKKRKAEDIKRLLSEAGTRGVSEPDLRISYTLMDGKESLDRASLDAYIIAQGRTMDDFITVGAPYTRLTISTPKVPV